MRVLFVLMLLVLLAPLVQMAVAATPDLDRAVLDYESGRLEQARSRFEVLARRGVAAAKFNLAVIFR